jgi:hypothetical protein
MGSLLGVLHIVNRTPYPCYVSYLVLANLRTRRVRTGILRDWGGGYSAVQGCIRGCEQGCEKEDENSREQHVGICRERLQRIRKG